MSKITYVNLADLFLPEFQAHSNIHQDHIRELADSIRDIGIIEPLIIRKTKQGFEIVAGCLRYHAALLAGLKAAPCIIMSLDSKTAEVIKLHENIKRTNLDHIAQGHTFVMMMEKFNMTEDEISNSVGKSIGYISQRITLVRLNNELTRAVEDGSISFSQARELSRVDDKSERLRLLSFCRDNGATIQVLQGWIQDYKRSSAALPAPESNSPDESYSYENPHISRFCEACRKSVEIDKIRQVYYCPDCYTAIKNAISDEAQNIKHNSSDKDSPEQSG